MPYQMKKSLLIILSIIVIFTLSTQVFANMFSFSKKQDVTLSHAVQGRLLKGGEPLKNVTVHRTLTYGKDYVDDVETNHEGYFSFPEKVIQSSKPSKMFDNDSVVQHIYIQHDGEEVTLWAVAPSYHESSNTLARNLKQLICDLDREAKTYDLPIEEYPQDTFAIFTMCKLN